MLINTHTAALPLMEHTKEMLPVAIIMPFNPKMTPSRECESRLRLLAARIERELMSRYPAEIAIPVIRKVQEAIKSLNSMTHKSSVAIFVTEEEFRTLYMDIPVEETLIVDTPFAIKDIPDCRADEREYLVLLFGNRNARIYLSAGGGYRLIQSNRLEASPDSCFHHIDAGLDVVLAAWPRPVFVIGEPRVTDQFRSLTRHAKNIMAYIHQEPAEGNPEHWKHWLGPYLVEWEKVREAYAMRLIEKATDAGELVAGFDEVARQARWNNARLLVVEKGYRGERGVLSNDFGLTDAVDRIVWQVLSNGGKVERVEKDSLKHLGRIALVKFY